MNNLKKINPNRSITVKNSFFDSLYRNHPLMELSVPQMKLILALVSQIDAINDTDVSPVSMDIKDFCDNFNISFQGGRNRQLLEDNVTNLMEKVLRVEEGRSVTLHHWVEYARIDYDTQTIDLMLSRTVLPYYIQIKRNFTTYKLGFVSGFKSKYTFLLYEILKKKQTEKNGQFFIPIEKLKQELSGDKYSDNKDFRVRVLEPAVAEINEKSDILVSYGISKKGNKANNVCFTIRQKKKKDIEAIQATWPQNFDLYKEEKKIFAELNEQALLESFEGDNAETVIEEKKEEIIKVKNEDISVEEAI